MIEKVSQSVHNSIWRSLHTILMIKENVSSNSNSNSNSNRNNNNDENRDSTMTETTSPLRSLGV